MQLIKFLWISRWESSIFYLNIVSFKFVNFSFLVEKISHIKWCNLKCKILNVDPAEHVAHLLNKYNLIYTIN